MLGDNGQGHGERRDGVRGEQREEDEEENEEEDEPLPCRLSP